MANDSILKKNDDVVSYMVYRAVPYLITNADAFKSLQQKILALEKECYDIQSKLDPVDQKSMPIVNAWFGSPASDDGTTPATGLTKTTEDQFIWMKPAGVAGDYEKLQLASLDKKMPRLDQLVAFERSNAYQLAPLRAKLESASTFDQAFFLNQHANQFGWAFMIALK